MGRIKWYKRDPDAALSGMMSLTLEERGAYNTLLDLLYTRDGDLPDDDRFLAGWMRCDVRVWRRIKMRLVDAGKITLHEGKITNFRATSEILAALHRVERAREAGLASAAKSSAESGENNDMTPAPVERHPQQPLLTATATTTVVSEEEEQQLRGRIVHIINSPSLTDTSRINEWRVWGADATLILSVIGDTMQDLRGKGKDPPHMLSFFDKAIRRSISLRTTPHQQEGKPHGNTTGYPTKADRAKTALVEGLLEYRSGNP